jgi:hypothetical protein
VSKRGLPIAIATLVAVPIAIVAGVLAFRALEPALDEPDGADDADRSPVAVEVPVLDEDDAVICLALTAKAPDDLGGLQARPVEGGAGANEAVLAYGDPAVVVTCGAEPAELQATTPVYVVNGVCWAEAEADADDAAALVTVDRVVPVSARFPEGAPQPADVLSDLSPLVADAVFASEDAPTNCS